MQPSQTPGPFLTMCREAAPAELGSHPEGRLSETVSQLLPCVLRGQCDLGGGRGPLACLAGVRTRVAHRSCGLVDRFCGISRQRVDRLRMAVAAMWAASMSCV